MDTPALMWRPGAKIKGCGSALIKHLLADLINSSKHFTFSGVIATEISNLVLYNNPITASIVSANNKLAVDSAYIVKIAPKIYICYGYVSILNSIRKDENIFAISNLANSSSLLLYGAESGLFTPLLYRNGNMVIPNNVTLQPGYYYVSGTLISNITNE